MDRTELLDSAKGADAHRQGEENLAGPSGGALDTAAVLRVLLKSCENTEIETLAQVQSDLHRAQSELNQCRQLLDSTGLPIFYWPRQAHKLLLFFQKQRSQANRDFDRALRSVRSQSPKQTTTTAKAKSEPEPPPPPPVKVKKKTRLYQTIGIQVVDGEVITKIDQDASFWLASNFREDAFEICRQMHFINGVIPEPYDYVRAINGEPCPTREHLMVYYSAEEFERICRLEVETNSPHVLGGVATSFYWQGTNPTNKLSVI